MKDKKLQVFVSSTYNDLKEERQAAVEAILSSGHIPAGMELFSAGDESQMTVIKRWIEESDIYLLILGGRYGSIETNTKKSYIELEYEYALSLGKPLFSIVISESALDTKVKNIGRVALEDQNPKLLSNFRNLVLANLVKFWDDKKDIKIAIHETLSDFSFRKEPIGWVRSDKTINNQPLIEEITRLTKENLELRDRISKPNSSSNALYVGLEFTQMFELLNSEPVNLGEGEQTLFSFFYAYGERLASGFFSPDRVFSKYLDRLILYKLVYFELAPNIYKLTEVGYNFFLKSLHKTKYEK